MRLYSLSGVAAFLLSSADAYPSFRYKIPNGDRVPCPDGEEGCDPADFSYQPASVCNGVGHNSCRGTATGYRQNNQFGKDFYDVNMQWTKGFCEQDSDGDGQS